MNKNKKSDLRSPGTKEKSSHLNIFNKKSLLVEDMTANGGKGYTPCPQNIFYRDILKVYWNIEEEEKKYCKIVLSQNIIGGSY